MSAPTTSLGRLLLQRFRWFDESLRARLSAAGHHSLSYAHSMVFASLDAEGTSQAELARRIGVTRQAVNQPVADLVELGLVTLTPDPSDRRAKVVELTDEGRANVAAALDTFAAIEAELGERIGVDHLGAMRAALEADWGDPLR